MGRALRAGRGMTALNAPGGRRLPAGAAVSRNPALCPGALPAVPPSPYSRPMRIGAHLEGIHMERFSPLPPAECAARINAAAPRSRVVRVGPIGEPGPAGGVEGDRLRLFYSEGFFTPYRGPELTGRLIPEGSGTRLQLRYGAPPRAYRFAGCLILWALGISLAGLTLLGPAPGESRVRIVLIFLAVPIVAVLALLLGHYMWSVHAMQNLDELLRFLKETVQAAPRGQESPK